MRRHIIQHNKFCINKYLCIENQVQEEEIRKLVITENRDPSGTLEKPENQDQGP